MKKEQSIADKVMERIQHDPKAPDLRSSKFEDEFVRLFREYRNSEIHGRDVR